jgi:hypothetical protein
MTRGARRGLLWLGAFVALLGALAVLFARGPAVDPAGYGPAPAFALPDLQGRTVTLAELGGANVVLRFGSVACTDCASDWNLLGQWQRGAGSRIRIVAVEVGQPADVVRVKLSGEQLPVPVLVDAGGQVAAAYGVRSLPSFAFIDAGGRLLAVDPVITHGAVWSASTWTFHLDQLLRADQAEGAARSGAALR